MTTKSLRDILLTRSIKAFPQDLVDRLQQELEEKAEQGLLRCFFPRMDFVQDGIDYRHEIIRYFEEKGLDVFLEGGLTGFTWGKKVSSEEPFTKGSLRTKSLGNFPKPVMKAVQAALTDAASRGLMRAQIPMEALIWDGYDYWVEVRDYLHNQDFVVSFNETTIQAHWADVRVTGITPIQVS